jgi:hypothetical protein
MQIPYEIKDAGLGLGQGIFVKELVPKGTLVWKYSAGLNVLQYDAEAAANRLAALPTLEEAQKWLTFTYGFFGMLNEVIDDGKFMNHSKEPNCKSKETGDTYSIRDIEAGEQLFEDYTSFGIPLISSAIILYTVHSKSCVLFLQNIPNSSWIYYGNTSVNLTTICYQLETRYHCMCKNN